MKRLAAFFFLLYKSFASKNSQPTTALNQFGFALGCLHQLEHTVCVVANSIPKSKKLTQSDTMVAEWP